MSPGATCVIAKRLVGNQFRSPKAPAEPKDDGVWVTYYMSEGGMKEEFQVHRSELEALRVAVEDGYRAVFLDYNSEI